MWQIVLVSFSFITYTHCSILSSNIISSAVSDVITKSISTVLNGAEDELGHFVSLVTPVLATIDITKHLQSDTQSMDTAQLIRHYGGCKVEEHTVNSDGYILKMFRIPGDGPSVFLMHGLMSSSDGWVNLGNNSLPLILASRNYDVWLGNARGNTYSRKHIHLSTRDSRFWDFSFDEMGTNDLAVFLDHVRETVGKEKKLLYVGHSQGTTMAYILLSEKPEYNAKLTGVVSLAPISFLSNAKGPVLQLLIKLRKEVEVALRALGFYEVLPNRPPISTVTAICGSSKLLNTICLTVFFNLFGYDYDQIDYNHARDQMSHIPAGCAWKQIIHYLQIGAQELFRKYDYGGKGNMKKYGTNTPPSYKLGNISVNMSLIYGANDWMSDVKDVNKLSLELPTKPEIFEVKLDKFNHIDFIWAKDAYELVYCKVLESFEKYIS